MLLKIHGFVLQSVASSPNPRADISILSQVMSLYEDSPNNILNRALVLHANADDLGRGNNPGSQKDGNSGAHLACGLVSLVDIEELAAENEEKHAHQQHGMNHRQEKSPLQGWEDISISSKMGSNLNVEGIVKPVMPHGDGFELKTALPTRKGKNNLFFELFKNNFLINRCTFV